MLYWHQNKCSVHLLLSEAAKLYRKWLFIGKEVWPSSICLVGWVHSFEPLYWINKICTLTKPVLTIWLQLSLANHHTQTHLITELCSKPWDFNATYHWTLQQTMRFNVTHHWTLRQTIRLWHDPWTSEFHWTSQSYIYTSMNFFLDIKISRDWEGGRELTW